MAFNEFWEAQCTEMELLTLCGKIEKEITLEKEVVKKLRLAGDEFDYDGIDEYENDILVTEKVYNEALIEAIAGDVSGFVAVAEKDVEKNGLYRKDGKLNNYVIAMRELGCPNFNSFMYVLLTKEKKYKEAEPYLTKAIEQKEEISDFLYGFELFRKHRRRKACKCMDKIIKNKNHPLRKQARALKVVYEPISMGLRAVATVLLLGCFFTFLTTPLAFMVEDIIFFALGMMARFGLIVLGVIAPWWQGKHRFKEAQEHLTFDSVLMHNTDESYGGRIDCPEIPSQGLGNSEVEYCLPYENMSTGVYSQNVSGQSEIMVDSIRYIVKQIHEKRILRKQYYMDRCKNGDGQARMALLIFFDIEYKNGEFVENKNLNPCQFIPKTIAKVID